MSTLTETARGFAHQYLNFEKSKGITDISIEKIQEIIEKVSAIDFLKEMDKNLLFEILMADLSKGKGEIHEISNHLEPWLLNEKANITPHLWGRYKLYMDKKDPSFPINDLDDFTDRILDKCVNPKQPGSWDRRGMVVGHVQSGKTSNYVGLINKATDAGYKLIIIIAGTMNSLRRQTQQRVDEGFIGVNSSTGKVIGVGEIKTDIQIYPLTSSSVIPDGDFEQKSATKKGIPIGKNPVVLIIKKNKSILENLIDWLSANDKTELIDGKYKLFDVPTLIIDDEADSASINTVSRKKITKEEALEEAKTINKLIRTLLTLFDKNTFIGYTATPYANLFIPKEWKKELTTTVKDKEYHVGEDLFPKDFIINIKAAKNYVGASTIFGYDNSGSESDHNPLDIIRTVNLSMTPFVIDIGPDENGDPILKTPKKDDALPEELPESLKTAIKSFIITCAVRRLRGQESKHNSMLIHAMLYVRWIDWLAYLVNEELRAYREYILGNDKVFLAELQTIYETDFVPTTDHVKKNLPYKDIRIETHSWETVLKELKGAVSKIEVRAVHGTKSTSKLEYKNIEEIDYEPYDKTGLSVIAVGGSRLARGITLEGLSISYYLRASKMYDTLMQMGRWFGYRPGYADLMRLYTTETITAWFNHISMATEDMRNDFDELSSQSGVTPDKFKLKVQNHPGLLSITSATKLYWAENINISFSGQNPQTYQLLKTEKAIAENFKAFNKMINSLGVPKPENKKILNNNKTSHLLYKNINVDYLCEFLDSYQIDQPSIKNSTLSGYIRKQAQSKNIDQWNVAIRSNTDDLVFVNLSGEKNPGDRRPYLKAYPIELFEGRDKITLGATVRNQTQDRDSKFFLISKNQIDELKDRKIDLEKSDLKSDEIKKHRSEIRQGLILIYLLDPRGTIGADFGLPIVGYSIHFPLIENEEKISYTATLNPEFDKQQEDDDDNKDYDL